MTYLTTNPSQPQSTIAPSEKHLEDWIVTNPQRFFEDLRISGRYIADRQVQLSCGIADLIAAVKVGIRVIELKKGVVTGEAVTQVMRYVGELRQHYQSFMSDCETYNDPHYHELEHSFGSPTMRFLDGVVIGHSFDKNSLLACYTLEIRAYQYEYDGQDYTFEEVSADLSIDYGNILSRKTVSAFKEAMRHRRLMQQDMETLTAIYKQEGSL